MGKKGKRTSKAARRRSKANPLSISVLALVVIAGGLSFYLRSGGESSAESQTVSANETDSASADPSLRNRLVLPAWPQRPRPVTLNPQMFTEGVVRDSYQAAKDVPEVLERMPCYCGCYSSSGHRNNLQCYADNHGATWALCRTIALEAQHQHQAGIPVDEIKRNIDRRYAPPVR